MQKGKPTCFLWHMIARTALLVIDFVMQTRGMQDYTMLAPLGMIRARSVGVCIVKSEWVCVCVCLCWLLKRGSLQQNTIMPGDSNFILWKYRGCILATRGHSKTGGGWQLVDILLVYFESCIYVNHMG